MTRKNESILDLLVSCPWWVSVLLSGASFVFLKFILPSINFQTAFMNGVFQGLSGFTPFLVFVLLIPAPIFFFNTSRKKRLLDSQTKLINRTVLIHDAKSVDPLQPFDPPSIIKKLRTVPQFLDRQHR